MIKAMSLKRRFLSVLCWGRSIEGQTGRGSSQLHHGLLPPFGLENVEVSCVSAGLQTSGFVSKNGKAYTCGSGLGLGFAEKYKSNPTLLGIDADVSKIFLGESTGVALDSFSSFPYVWGVGSEGQLGLGGAMGPQGSYHGGEQLTLSSLPLALKGEALVSAALTRHRTILLTQNGKVFVAGSGFSGELGVASSSGVITSPASVVGIPENERVVSIAGGLTFSLAATSSGRLFFWGSLGHGGENTATLKHFSPVELILPGRSSANYKTLRVAAGLHHALVTDGAALWAIGSSWRNGGFEENEGLVRRVTLPRGVKKLGPIAAGPWSAGVVTDDCEIWLAGRIESPFLLGGDVGPSATKSISEALKVCEEEQEQGGNRAQSLDKRSLDFSRAELLQELGLDDEIGVKGAFNGDGLTLLKNGIVFSPRLVRVIDTALRGKRVKDLALGSAHAIAVVENIV